MIILVYDKYNYPRDLAQMDIYKILESRYEITYSNPDNLMQLIEEGNYDILYLGIYHPWVSDISWNNLFKINKKPIIIDQADNEGFIYRKETSIKYEGNYILLSRYLPNKSLENFWNGKLFLLPWYIDSNRFIPQEKNIDISFICTINNNRIGADRIKLSQLLESYFNYHNLNYKIGEFWNKEYSDILARTKCFVIDGSRGCLTQKYIEAALSKCLLVGSKPKYPSNNLITTHLKDINNKTIDKIYSKSVINFNRDYILENFSNKEKFINNFDKIISNF